MLREETKNGGSAGRTVANHPPVLMNASQSFQPFGSSKLPIKITSVVLDGIFHIAIDHS